jgi:hypothetical protein
VVPVLVVLVVGALDMWRRGASFQWGTDGGVVGALAGGIAVAVAWLVTGGWASDLDPVALLALAVATELALRGWLVELVYRGSLVARRGPRRVADDAAGQRTVADDAAGARMEAGGWRTQSSEMRAVPAVLAGAIAEALLTPGNLTMRLGAGAFGAGLGWMYIRAGLLAPLAARVVFVVGGIALQWPW